MTEAMPNSRKAHYLPHQALFNLHHACALIEKAYPDSYGVFLVGSSIERPDYRDVDVRCMLPDEAYIATFPNSNEDARQNDLWALLSLALSAWLAQTTGLPIDFQFQKASTANEKHKGKPRSGLGHFVKFGDAT